MLFHLPQSHYERRITPPLQHLIHGDLQVRWSLSSRSVHFKTPHVLQLVRLGSVRALLAHLNELCQDVVALSAVPRQLVVAVSLEYIGPSFNQVPHNVEVPTVTGQMQGSQLVDAARRVQVEFF